VATVTDLAFEAAFSERDNVYQFGTLLDELARHHPPLRPVMIDSVLEVFNKAVTQAIGASPSDVLPATEVPIGPGSTIPGSAEPISPLEHASKVEDPRLVVLTKVFKVCLHVVPADFQFLQGLLRNGTLCEDFIENGTFDRIIDTVDLPCIPARFMGYSDTAAALSSLVRIFGEHEHVKVAESLIKSVQERLENYLQSSFDPSHDTTASGFCARLNILSEAFNTLATSHQRITAFIRLIGVKSESSFLPNLGSLHGNILQQHAQIRAATPLSPSSPSASLLIGAEITSSTKHPTATALPTRMHVALIKLFKGKR
jgi:hypothetical protein